MAERNRNDLMEMAKALGHGDFVYRHGEVPLFTRAQGCVLEESSGKKFLDAEAANGTAGLGFDSGIVAATQETLKDLPALPSFCESELRCRVASSLGRLLDRATGAKGRIAFELGGAQGIELALKIVRANSLGTQFAVFEGGYHGRSGFASQFSASHRYRQAVGEWRLPIVRLPYPDCEQCRFSRKRTHCNNECIAFADGLISSEIGGLAARGSLDVAALLIEPVLNAGGIVWPDPQYLEAIVDRMRERGAIIVVDEIFTGFYRTGTLWGFQHYDLVPDIVVVSKALTNGVAPLSCVWARADLLNEERFPPGSHSATYLNYPFGLAVAEQVLRRYEDWEGLPERLEVIESALRDTVETAARRFPGLVKSGHARGALARLLLHRPVAGRLVDRARTVGSDKAIMGFSGMILASTGLTPNVVAFNPPLTITDTELEALNAMTLATLEGFDREMEGD